MRRQTYRRNRHGSKRLLILFLFIMGTWIALCFNAYVNDTIRPTLMQLAEYEARALTTEAVNAAAQKVLTQSQDDTDLYVTVQDALRLNMTKANALKASLLQAVSEELEKIPKQEYKIPFGSLTGNSLLSGHGPAWNIQLEPEGFAQARWKEDVESIAINVTRYSASLELSVVVNMVLDGRTETLTVTDSVPLVSVLLCGETPSTYATIAD